MIGRIVLLIVLAAASIHAGVVKVFFVNGGRLHATHKGCSAHVEKNSGAVFKVKCGDKAFVYSTNMFGFISEDVESELIVW